MKFFKNKEGKYKLGWILVGLLLTVIVGVVIGNLMTKQQKFDSATKKPVDEPTYTKNVLAVMRLKKR